MNEEYSNIIISQMSPHNSLQVKCIKFIIATTDLIRLLNAEDTMVIMTPMIRPRTVMIMRVTII